MNSLDNLKLSGKLKIVVTGEDGSLKDSREVDNLVVSAGITYIASRIKDATATAMSHMAVGTGAVAAAAGNTTLGAESARVALTSTTANATNVVYVASFPAGTGTAALTEAGILNAASAGTMLCRTVFSVINKGANDTMTITWTINLVAV
jgi:hypothetical protein